ncbi:50S ribosomal protein L25/general stress protein Ctc [Leucobacter sp. M11]|uniref:50S ribosomal protein L25/general stress protein Ctc n=1 Tax=Leucobacter sp. M11 TaxID=2993565 RepID=UPI002D7EA83F|nr:50S ribosomal protein L25/general stress protein Ctc [Leucobacter sp. M11]MEB4613938.1 50S ribosomal protein L25/general stress protein Ctc [Leucobacter sp. M11]
MKQEYTLAGTARETFGKGVARKLRAAGQTPAVIYGHGTDPIHLSVEAHPLSLIVRRANALIEVDLDGAKHLVLVKDVQRDPVRQIIEHIDLIIVKEGETVEVEVPVIVEGISFSGTNALLELQTMRLSVPATSIPQNITVNVDGLTAGTMILAGQIELPKGSTVLDDAEQLVVNIVEPRGASEDEDGEEAAAE